MELLHTPKFRKDYKSLPKNIQGLADKQLGYLLKNPKHPSLNVKKMQDPRNIWEGKINYAYRFTFYWEGKICILRRIGTHDILKKP